MAWVGPIISAANELAPEFEGKAEGAKEHTDLEQITVEEHTNKKGLIAHHWKLKQTKSVEADYTVERTDGHDQASDAKQQKQKRSKCCCSCFGRFKTKS